MPVLRQLLRGISRGANRHKEMTSKRGNKHFHPNTSRIQNTGYSLNLRFKNVKEMIPEIIVPDLKDFPLKAYVSYRVPDTQEDPLTPREIFEKCVAPKVIEDFKAGKYDQASPVTASAADDGSDSHSGGKAG
ncbi:large ribosomal subunit protein mL41-like [Diadema setosum]|uniref:large ribosomal subunit protein mL41-like n=1 Tax=Diadema setosum TaxID=31175 RepID=UPI003B3AAAB8